VDVSKITVRICRGIFVADASKRFLTLSDHAGERAELILYLGVLYHLIEDDVFTVYMATLFDTAARFVIIYSSNQNQRQPEQHVQRRKFDDWIARNRPNATLLKHIPNWISFDPKDPDDTSFADVYEV